MRNLLTLVVLLLAPLAVALQAEDWLQDVRWIISEQEQAEYKQAASKKERKAFVEAFWQRRDPTPGTPANEFRRQWERRLQFVKKHFREDRPAAETDRARVYLLNGPPDEIKTQSGYEVWLYKGDETREWLAKDFAVVFQMPRADFFDQLGAARVLTAPPSAADHSTGEAQARRYQSGVTTNKSRSARYKVVLAGPQDDVLKKDGSLRGTIIFEKGDASDYIGAVLTPR
ncbi:MAG TPA: GWxTD domain-containing protein [Acidobacteriota bacterium]|nr:GWxTD domain-containing protein [Acidobacteriota bacterium]